MIFKFLDYVFYRTYRFYLKRHDNTPILYGSLVVSLIEFFVIIDILFIVRRFIDFEMPSSVYAAILFILIMGLNWFKYERNPDIEGMSAKWGGESDGDKSTGGTIIVIVIVVVISLPIIVGLVL